MSNIKVQSEEQKCSKCGGTLRYNEKTGILACDYCEDIIDLGLVEDESISDFDLRDFMSRYETGEEDGIRIYSCVSCGAEVLAGDTDITITCPYCSNRVVLTDRVSGRLRPGGVVPFKISKDQIPGILNDFYKDKPLLPKNFFSQSSLLDITGVYVPFWLISGNVKGDMSLEGIKTFSVQEDREYRIDFESHYRLIRDADIGFKRIPVDASEKISEELMDSLEPFDMSDIRPFDSGYLAGFAAERFDSAGEDITERAGRRMKNTAVSAVKKEAGGKYSRVNIVGSNLNAKVKDVEYILLPVYLFDLDYNGEKYSFAMNGQSGKVVGSLPVNMGRKRLRRILWTLIGAVATAAVLSLMIFAS